jgi:hypothetical protein
VGVFEQFPYTNYHDLNLDWILQKTKEALTQVDVYTGKVDVLTTTADGMQDEIDIVNKEISAINADLENIEKGEYVELYLNSVISWIDNNLQKLVASIVKYVTFEIDSTGHFIAYIPDSWDFMRFDTIVDTNDENYGHLTFEW